MPKALGSAGSWAVSADGVTYTTVGKVKSASLPPSIGTVDATDNDSAGQKEKLVGDIEWSGSVTCNYDSADAGQTLVINAASGKTLLYHRYRPKGSGTGELQWIGPGYLTSCTIDSAHESVIELSFDVDFTVVGGVGVVKSVI